MSIIFRPGAFTDNFAAYRVHHNAMTDLLQRLGFASAEHAPTQQEIIGGWAKNRSLYEHLTRTAEQFWVAEQDGEIVGYSRSCHHDGVRQLSEFFVLPSSQAKGVGKELLAHALPRQPARLRLVTATPKLRAQALYLRSGVYARQLLYRFSCIPQPKQALTTRPQAVVGAAGPAAAQSVRELGAVRGLDRRGRETGNFQPTPLPCKKARGVEVEAWQSGRP